MRLFLLTILSGALCSPLPGAALPEFDFTQAEVCKEWGTPHDITGMRHTAEGLEVSIAGQDPYFYGPARDYPEDKPLWLLLKLRSDEGGDGQIFYFRDQAREEASTHFQVEAGKWTEVRLGLPALGRGYRLRLDPPGSTGKTVIASIHFESAASLAAPTWPKPAPVDFTKAVRLRSGPLELQLAGQDFRLTVEGRPVADSHSRLLLGYTVQDKLRWLDLHTAQPSEPRLETRPNRATVTTEIKDEDGATWRFSRSFQALEDRGAIEFKVAAEVDQERAVVFLPLLLLVAGQEEPGAPKQQGLFAGLEYLENEPSSSEADVIGAESKRQVPANHKITFPFMSLLRGGRYVGLIWDHTPQFSVLFDSPDRVLGSGGHVMGVLAPGSDRYNRHEGFLMPTRPQILPAGQPLILHGHLVGGTGASLVPAIQQYVSLRGLPTIAPIRYSFPDYASLAAHGWLDSKIREGNRFRHAVWQGFGATPAADAALMMNWLAGETTDPALRQRLDEMAETALSAVNPASYNHSGVSHVRYPVQALVYGHVAENAAAAQAQARGLLGRFSTDGSIPYRRTPGQEDYGRTHFAPDANGLTAQVAASLLEAAAFAGDRPLIEQAVQRLRGLNKFRNTVPRGAQTWEVPLHTPDILASAHLVRAYTLGYELTGEKDFLDQAVYWAWTGVPFVYLVSPVGLPDRPYGTIPVYGATSWRAPVWFGRPVQWCGLVYADALYRLVRHDPKGPWKQLADGITSVGVYYSWPSEDKNRQGLLPDVWEMLAQRRDGPAINPGTVQANAVRYFGKGSLYDCRSFRPNSQVFTVHAPGAIQLGEARPDGFEFRPRAWPRQPYYVLINGLGGAPRVTVDGQPISLAQPHEYLEKEGWLILQLRGQPLVQVRPSPQ